MTQVVIALLLNALLVAAFSWWLRREYRRAAPQLRRWLLPALAVRLLGTAVSTNFPSPDARFVGFWSRGLTAGFWARPSAALALWQGQQITAEGQVLAKYALSNTLFFIKILGLLNLASLGSVLLNTLYLSLFCFVGCWLLVRTWVRLFPASSLGAAVGALLLWPSVVWWTAGIGKETVLVGCEAALVALALQHLYGPLSGSKSGSWHAAIARLSVGLVLAWLAYRMRYFFTLPLVGGLLALALVRSATRWGWVGTRQISQAAATLLVLALGGGVGFWWALGQVSEHFYPEQLFGQYQHGLATSAGRPHLLYAHLAPTAASLLRYAPAAVGQVFARPWLGESASPLYAGAGLENLLLISLLALAAVAWLRGRAGRLPLALVVVLLGYCVVVAAFIGLSTPNLGTLHRYRAALLPWLLLVVLQNDYARQAMQSVFLHVSRNFVYLWKTLLSFSARKP